MFVRLLSAQGDPGAEDLDSMLRLINEQVIPRVRQEPGFKATYFLFDRRTNKLTSVTFYEGEADVQRAMESIRSLREQALGAMGLGPIATDAYEVIASTGSL